MTSLVLKQWVAELHRDDAIHLFLGGFGTLHGYRSANSSRFSSIDDLS